MPRRRIALKLIAGFALALLARVAFAGAESDLIAAQAREDVVHLTKTLDWTRQAATDIEQQLRAKGVTQFAMVRFPLWVHQDNIWVLYRVEEKTYVAAFFVESTRVRLWSMREADPAEWDQVFNTFFVAQQKKPAAPLPKGAWMRDQPWVQGYSGIVNIEKEGAARTYLLATDDLLVLHIQSTWDELLCSTIFSGLHCHNGSTTTNAWVQQRLEGLMHNSQKTTTKLIELTKGNP